MAQETGRLAENIVLLRPRIARGRHSGRSRLGARCAGRGRSSRRRHAGRFLLDAARGVREAPRAHRCCSTRRSASSFAGAATLDKLLAAMLPQAPPREDEKPPPGAAARAGGAVLEPRRGRAQAAGARGRRAPHRVGPRGAAEEGLRADDGGRDRGRQGRDQAPGAVARRGEDAAPCARTVTVIASICAAPCAQA